MSSSVGQGDRRPMFPKFPLNFGPTSSCQGKEITKGKAHAHHPSLSCGRRISRFPRPCWWPGGESNHDGTATHHCQERPGHSRGHGKAPVLERPLQAIPSVPPGIPVCLGRLSPLRLLPGLLHAQEAAYTRTDAGHLSG